MRSTTPGRSRTEPNPAANSVPRSSGSIGVASARRPARRAASPNSSAGVRAGVEQRAHRGVALGLRQLLARRPPDERVVEERGGVSRPRRRARRSWTGVASSRSRPRMTRSMPWRMSSTTTHSAYVQLPSRSRTRRSPAAAGSSASGPPGGRSSAPSRPRRPPAGPCPRPRGVPSPAVAGAADPAPRPAALGLVRRERGPRARARVHDPRIARAGRARPRTRPPSRTADRASGRPGTPRSAARRGRAPAARGRRGSSPRTPAATAGGRGPRSAGSPGRRSPARSPTCTAR